MGWSGREGDGVVRQALREHLSGDEMSNVKLHVCVSECVCVFVCVCESVYVYVCTMTRPTEIRSSLVHV